MEKELPDIPAKRYFTIGEVSELCGVKPYVLRYWEQEFTQLKPMKRRGNRRYYQHHEVLLVRRIRELLYDQGFTISGARNRLADAAAGRHAAAARGAAGLAVAASAAGAAGSATAAHAASASAGMAAEQGNGDAAATRVTAAHALGAKASATRPMPALEWAELRRELHSIRRLLEG